MPRRLTMAIESTQADNEVKQLTNADRVGEFHRAVGGVPPPLPTIPSPEVIGLRRALITEEYREVMEALDGTMEEGDVTKRLATLAGELADLLYVTYGTLVECGIDADTIFQEVHRSNLQKARGPKRADGKAMKPADWKAPDLEAVVRRLMHTPEKGC
jgi:predicted HAD superfamily Cof-like phosphohydrolase